MRRLLVLLTILFLAAQATAQSAGIAPSVIDLGTVKPGSEIDLEFYVSSGGTNENFTVSPAYNKPLKSNIFGGEDNIAPPSEYSEQDISSWLTFSQDTYEVDPSTSRNFDSPGGTVSADRVIQATLRVPDDAEPGYHAGQVRLNPDFGSGGEGFGTSIVATSRSRFFFRVPGEVNRDVDLESLEAVRLGEKEVQLVASFRNTGSVTVTMTGGTVPVYNSRDQKIGSVSFPSVKIPPGGTRRVEGFLISDELAGGEFRLDGTVGYRTGQAYIGEEFVVTSAPQPQQRIDVEDPGQQGEQQASAPLLLILVAMIGIGSVLYAFGFDMLWALLSSLIAGIAIFIITSGLPVYVLLAALMGAGIMVYLQW